MGLRDLDYIIDKEGNFFVIHSYGKKIYGNLVFAISKSGLRYSKLTNKYYNKVILSNFDSKLINKKIISKILKPDKFFMESYNNLPEKWKKIPEALMKIGLEKESIGIFGSYLLGFNAVHDIDFVVYGKSNCVKVMKNISRIRKFCRVGKISKKHINYQFKKYGKYYSKNNDLEEILSRNWAGLQFSKGILSTIRFIYNEREIPEDINIKKGVLGNIEGKVIESFGANFMPRIAYLKSKGKLIRILTYNWMFNAFLNKGERVFLRGYFKQRNNTIYILDKKCWVKITRSSKK